ncbi:hypothetical protein MTP99_011488 [Tenebrio molitor]|nr:hypothetical protein MTP99_011488 [Tenebrio molitor]
MKSAQKPGRKLDRDAIKEIKRWSRGFSGSATPSTFDRGTTINSRNVRTSWKSTSASPLDLLALKTTPHVWSCELPLETPEALKTCRLPRWRLDINRLSG